MSIASPARREIRRWIPLGLVFVTVGLSTAMAMPYLTLFLDDAVHASAVQAAVLLAAAPVASVVASAVLGRLSDRLPSRRGLLLGTALAGCAGSALTAVVRDYWVFLIITVTLTACAQAVFPQTFAYAREALEGSDRAAMTMSTLRTLFSAAWVAGPPLASILLTAGGFTLTYAIAAAMYALAALVVFLAFRQRRPTAVEDDAADAAGADAPRPIIWLTVAMFVLVWAAAYLAVQALPPFITSDLGSIGTAGLLLGLCAGLEIPLMLGFGMLATRMPIHRLLVIGAACGLGYMALASFATSLWPLVVGQLLNATAIATMSGLGITYMQDMLPRDRGRSSTLYSNAIPMGALLAGPILGAAQQTGYRLPFALGAVLYAGALVLLLLTRDTRPATRTS
ncbi:sugar efflux transporter [Luedemannella flava]|uniref:Sugar efflux transporter n=1 Tax=Luedemannella flava TaxID=349316 RepID=A0ABP4YT37_9ACTN